MLCYALSQELRSVSDPVQHALMRRKRGYKRAGQQEDSDEEGGLEMQEACGSSNGHAAGAASYDYPDDFEQEEEGAAERVLGAR
jgi:hypothetical protein